MDRKLKSSSSSHLPLAWILEVLARSDKVAMSVLLDLVKMAPDISDPAFRDVRELISLRILESMLTHETSVSSNSTQKIRFHPSDRYEDVLRKIVPEKRSMSSSNLKAAGIEMSKWDVKPFIEHKRSSLPKCTLERVKDAIITASHPSLVSLREKSGLLVSNHLGNDAPVESGDCNGIATRPDRDELHAKISAEKDVLISPAIETTKHPWPSKRKRNIAAEITEGSPCKDLIVWEDSFETIMKAVKKYKPNALHCENQAAHRGMELPNDKLNRQGGQDRNIEDSDKQSLYKCTRANEDMNKLDQNTEGSGPNADEAEKGNSRADNDQYHDEKADIAKMKESFLSFKCSLSQDSLAVDWSELKLCVKCNEGDNVLFCCSESCPLVIHESCLGLDVSFDKDGKFYCPFCAYSQAFSAYEEARQKAFASRNDLVALINGKIRKETKEQPTRFYKTSRDNSNGVEDSAGAIYKEKLDEHSKSRDGKAINEVSERRDERFETRSKKGVSGSAETELRYQHKISPSAESCDAEEISQEDDECAGTSGYCIRVRKEV